MLITLAPTEVVVLKRCDLRRGGVVEISHSSEYGIWSGVLSGTPGVNEVCTPALALGSVTVTATKDNAGTLNLYLEGGQYKLQNNLVASKDLLIEYRAGMINKSDL